MNPIEDCKHLTTSISSDESVNICQECGLETEIITHEAEWRYYGAVDNRSSKDPARCHIAKQKTKGIHIILDTFPNLIKERVEQKFNKIVQETKGKKGASKKEIIAACLMYVLKESGDERSVDQIRKLFGLQKKAISNGITSYLQIFSKARTDSITPGKFIESIMKKTNVNIEHLPKIIKMCEYIEDQSPILKRSSPYSVACSIVYLYLCYYPEIKKSIGLAKSDYSKLVDLSDITIVKLAKETASILEWKEDSEGNVIKI